jgi:uncharacterized protein (UPF0261 family)
MERRVLIVATLDTKGREAVYAKECAEKNDVAVVLMDVGTLGTTPFEPDISSDSVARKAGYDLEEFRSKRDRSAAVRSVQEGGAILARELFEAGQIQGVFGMGGGTGTAVVTHIMRALPFGIPKVMLSTVASRDVREYVGTKDVVMFHSVADILGFNGFMRMIIEQAVSAVCGMMKQGSRMDKTKPMVAVTAYGINSNCAVHAEPLLEKKGYEMIAFHANGCGGMAMEEMIGEGLIAGVLDFTPHEIADEMYGGYCKGIGATRFETAGRMGVPYLFAPGGLDNAVFSPFYPMPPELGERRRHSHDTRFCVRLGPEEMVLFARTIGEKLNKAKGPVYVLVPNRGWSEADKPGMDLFDPAIDRVFVDELRRILRPQVPIEEMDVHISEPSFAERAVEVLDRLMRKEV